MLLRSLLFCLLPIGVQISAHQYEYFKTNHSHPSNSNTIDYGREAVNENKDRDILIPRLKAIIITGDDAPIPHHIRKTSINGVSIYRAMPTISYEEREKLRKELWRIAGNRPLTKAQIKRIKNKIRMFYEDHGQVHVIVTIPEQEITDGVLTVKVVEARVGKVTISGEKWFKKEYYRDNLRIEEDEVLNNDMMLEDLRVINNNPFRKATIIYKPGDKANTTDIELAIQDEKPIQFYIGADNTGFKETDYSRLFIGLNWGNFFTPDQIVAFQYTASPDFNKYQAYNLYYTATLPNRDMFTAFGGYSLIHASHADLPANVSKGQSWQISGRYVWPLMPRSAWMQEAKAGLDWKRTNNDFIVNELTISSSLATVFQIVGAYDVNYSRRGHKFEGSIEGYLQPWNLGDSMSDSTYDQLRPNASNHYFYTRIGGKYRYVFPTTDVAIQARLRMQFSTNALIPIELFGLGGFNSVRGYVEREINADDAVLFNFEVQSPSVSLSKQLHTNVKFNDSLSGLAFLDLGGGWLQKTSNTNQPSSYFLGGIGPGVRYRIIPYLEIRLDYGFRLTDVPWGANYTSIGRFNFSVIGSY